MPGPIPNRSSDLSRPRERKGSSEEHRNTSPLKTGDMMPVTIPDPDPQWHDIATLIYEGLISSGQSRWYQNSDWAIAYLVCSELSDYKRSNRRNAQTLNALLSTLGSLLATEGDRRRVRVELNEPKTNEVDASVVAIADYQKLLNVSKD